MLAGLCVALAQQAWTVSVVARDLEKLGRLSAQHPAIAPISIDYRDSAGFRRALGRATERRGPVQLAVCWIRSSEPAALRIVAEYVDASGRLLHVLGSASMAAAVDSEPIRRRLGSRYRRIVLGAVRNNQTWRWLSDDEISSGVLEAVARDEAEYLVGVMPA
jgi:NAD(P)-dependent dehydrogenase (short-subunit alcohol dehydrogenase family)